jgi:hypothetical protein
MKPVRLVTYLARGLAALTLTTLTIALLVIAPAQLQVHTDRWAVTAMNASSPTLTAATPRPMTR